MNRLTINHNTYNNTIKRQNDLLIKIVSVTDEVLKQQLQEEYLCILAELNKINLNRIVLEREYLSSFTASLFLEFTEFYNNHFEPTTLFDTLMHNGIDLLALEKKYKWRPIRSIQQKRELCLLMNDLKRQIKIVDYCSNTIDVIGKYIDPAPIIVRVAGFTSIDNLINSTEIVRLKSIN